LPSVLQNYGCASTPGKDTAEDVAQIYVQFDTYGKSSSNVKLKVSAEKHPSRTFTFS